MALLFTDGFSHYDTAHGYEKWDVFNAQINSSDGRFGGGALYEGYGKNVSKYFTNRQTLIMGAAFKTNDTTVGIFMLSDGSTPQVWLSLLPSGVLQVLISGSVVASSASGVIDGSVYSYVEFKVTIAPSSGGSATVRVNGVPVINVTGVTTSSDGNAYANVAGFQNGSNGSWFCDFYLCDDSGTTNNDFLGDVKVALALPNGDGRVNSFSQVGGTSGENWTSVDEVPPNDDTSYVYSSTAGATDTYTLSSIGTVSAVKAVQVVASARKDDAGTRVLAAGFGNGTTESYGSGVSLGTSYTMIKQPFDTNPLTSAAWTPAAVASGQIAIQVVS